MSDENENQDEREEFDEAAEEAEHEARVKEMRAEARKRFAEARKKYGRRVCQVFDEDHGVFIFKAANRMAMKEFLREHHAEDGDKLVAAENLALACVVYPTKERLSSVMEELSGLAVQASLGIQRISSAKGQQRGKG